MQRVAAVLGLLAQHGGEVRGVGADVRRHHHDIAMLQGGVIRQRAQQGVFQYFQFAQSRVAGMHAQAGVVAQSRQHVLGVCAAADRIANGWADQLWLQTANARLHLCQ